jgi:hypothetical protein
MIKRSDSTAATAELGVAGQLVARKESEDIGMRVNGQLSKIQTATHLQHLFTRGLGLAPRCNSWAEGGVPVELERSCFLLGLHLLIENQV